jgi:amidophosphoribosyltransferase
MCGIVGLHLRNRSFEPRLGELLVPMVDALTVRGPDSAGYALYRDDAPAGTTKYSLRTPATGFSWEELAHRLDARLGAPVDVRPRAGDVVLVTTAAEPEFRAALAHEAPEVWIFGWGHTMEIYKDVGWLPGPRAHPHGDRIGGHHRAFPSVRGR